MLSTRFQGCEVRRWQATPYRLPTPRPAGHRGDEGDPSAALAEELHQGQAANPFVSMSDNTDSYEGRLVLDLDRGQVREYVEQMQNEWIIADPTAVQTGQPTAIKMAARRLHRLERCSDRAWRAVDIRNLASSEISNEMLR